MSHPNRISLALATMVTVVLVCLAVWGLTVDPARPGRWAFVAFFLPGLWGYVELAQVRGSDRSVARALMNFHRCSIAWGGLLLAMAVGIQLAVTVDLLGPDWLPFRHRASGLILGFGFAVFGNYLPKLLSPWALDDEPFDWQRVHRFAGWVFMIGGIAIVTVWMAVSGSQARVLTHRILMTALLLVVARKFFSLATHSPATVVKSRYT